MLDPGTDPTKNADIWMGGKPFFPDYASFAQETAANNATSYGRTMGNYSRNRSTTTTSGGAGGTLPPAAGFGGSTPYGDLAAWVNQFMTGQAAMPYQMNLPNYQAMTGQRTQNILQQLQGNVPQDVINQILQQAAERGIVTGSPGAPGAGAAYLRALGLTSLGMQEAGSKNLSQAIADTPVPELWNPMSLYVPEYLARLELAAAKEKEAKKSTPTVIRSFSFAPGAYGGRFG